MRAASTGSREDAMLLRDDAGGVATLTLNRPAARNALSEGLIIELQQAFAAIDVDPSVRVVVLRANGPAFCSGHDLRELRSRSDRIWQLGLFRRCGDLMLAIVKLRVPVIARVHGIATAAGCQLVSSCDLAVASNEARFATPGVNIGLFCSTPMVALSRAVGRKKSLEMLLTGQALSADEAAAAGLVNRVVAPNELDGEVTALAALIASKSQLSVGIGKEAFYRQLELDLPAAYAYTAEVMARNLASHDACEGIDAFLEKRAPVWQDR
jgi:enoyl-CoA hydratase/carnithine racemase